MKARTEAGDPLPPCSCNAPMTRVAPRGGSWPRLRRFSSTIRGCSNARRLMEKVVSLPPIHAVGVDTNARGAPLSEQHPQGFDAKSRKVKDPVIALS